MKRSILVALVASVLVGCVSNPSERLVQDYPALKSTTDEKSSAITWTKFDGFDFLVFYGELPSDPTAGVGIYVGGDPTFKIPTGIQPIPGKLGVFDVEWFTLPDKDAPFYRTCLIDYQKTTRQRGTRPVTYITKRHVWAFADTEEGLNSAIAELNRLSMFAVKPPDINE